MQAHGSAQAAGWWQGLLEEGTGAGQACQEAAISSQLRYFWPFSFKPGTSWLKWGTWCCGHRVLLFPELLHESAAVKLLQKHKDCFASSLRLFTKQLVLLEMCGVGSYETILLEDKFLPLVDSWSLGWSIPDHAASQGNTGTEKCSAMGTVTLSCTGRSTSQRPPAGTKHPSEFRP